jgi:hypothetical protein
MRKELVLTLFFLGFLHLPNLTIDLCSAGEQSCIAVTVKPSREVLYFKEGNVEKLYEQTYCVFYDFEGKAVRFSSDLIERLDDVQVTDEILQKADLQKKQRVTQMLASSNRVRTLPRSEAGKKRPIPPQPAGFTSPNPQSPTDLNEPEPEFNRSVPPSATNQKSYWQNEIFRRFDAAMDLRKQAMEAHKLALEYENKYYECDHLYLSETHQYVQHNSKWLGMAQKKYKEETDLKKKAEGLEKEAHSLEDLYHQKLKD